MPTGIYLFKANNWNTRTVSEIYSNLTIKTPGRCQWSRSGIFVNFEQIFNIDPEFLMFTLNK